MLFDSQPTPFDLRWRMLGTDVRVHPSFWLICALLGWTWFNVGGFPYLLLWVLCVFVSILLHEFGHILMARAFGSHGHILLHSFGGLAIGVTAPKRWQRILISFAGPGIQFVLLGLVFLGFWFLLPVVPPESQRFLVSLLFMLYIINLFWPILNLLPIWPLDGGMITREVFEGIWKVRGVAYSLLVSGILSAVLAVHCLMASMGRPLIPFLDFLGGMWTGLFFAMFAVGSFQLWAIENQRFNRSSRYDDDRLPWE